jgi:hypothetical protein
MENRRSAPVLDPMREPELAWRALQITRHAEAMGLLEGDRPADIEGAEEAERFATALRSLAAHGIAVDAAALMGRPGRRPSLARVIEALDAVREALQDSPIPDLELRHLQRIFGWDGLAELLHVSVGSLRRYASSQRETPDDVAARAHWLAGVVGDLRGAYNDAGVRRWFARPRKSLRGRRPAEVLGQPWDPNEASVAEVRELAAWLAAPGAAT